AKMQISRAACREQAMLTRFPGNKGLWGHKEFSDFASRLFAHSRAQKPEYWRKPIQGPQPLTAAITPSTPRIAIEHLRL
ncbi:MAG: hypothetical protein KDE64_13155, partial [Rhodocyclaceae bacterium]|nr:hypothetical protein [Rhodocyclaceae bacterium]